LLVLEQKLIESLDLDVVLVVNLTVLCRSSLSDSLFKDVFFFIFNSLLDMSKGKGKREPAHLLSTPSREDFELLLDPSNVLCCVSLSEHIKVLLALFKEVLLSWKALSLFDPWRDILMLLLFKSSIIVDY